MKEKEENSEEIKQNEINNESNKKSVENEKNKEENNSNIKKIICHDKTIIEVSDKKWSRYLIPYKNILEYKLKITMDKLSNIYKPEEQMTLIDKKRAFIKTKNKR